MKPEDEFAELLSRAVLRSAGEEVQAVLLEDIVEQARLGEDLDSVIVRTMKSERRPGDFGMEIVGSLLVPVLLEAGRQLWAVYMKKLAEKGGEKLADATLTSAKKLALKAWSGEEKVNIQHDFTALIRRAGEKQGISPEDIEKLIAATQSDSFADELNAS